MSQELYETFWSLSLYDIYVPKARYEKEVDRLKKEVDRTEAGWKRDESLHTRESLIVRRMKQTVQDLNAEEPKQSSHVRACRRRVEKLKAEYLSNLESGEVSANSAQAILTHCIYPRCMLTTDDALYCSKFMTMPVSSNSASSFAFLSVSSSPSSAALMRGRTRANAISGSRSYPMTSEPGRGRTQ